MAVTAGSRINYSDYSTLKTKVNNALTKVGASYSWSSTVSSAGTVIYQTHIANLKGALDAVNARYCQNATACTANNSANNGSDRGSHTNACASNHSSNRANHSSNNSNGYTFNGGECNNFSSYCNRVYGKRTRCGGDIKWHILGHTAYHSVGQ